MNPRTTNVALLVLALLGHLAAFSQSAAGVVNAYYSVTSLSTATNSVIVDDATGLEPGEVVLIIQSKGATIDATNSATYGNVTAINTAGNYEFNMVCNVIGNQVWLVSQFVNSYDPTGQLQMVAVPSYQSVTVSGTINGSPWDPVSGKGGIVAIAATDTIFLNADIDVSGQGFIGGVLVNYPTPAPYNCAFNDNVNQYFLSLPASGDITGGKKGEGIAAYITNESYARGKLANGGGGGNNTNSGGAGGGNYGAGGNGGQRSGEGTFNCHGQYPGIGGLSLATYGYSAAANRIFLGGGGGSGQENNAAGEPGGNGGGIILLSAPVIIGGGGKLLANGKAPVNYVNSDSLQAEGDGGGGGGAGGAVILNVLTVTGAVEADAKGAAGSNSSNRVSDCTGPGGGGGGGVVWAAGASFPAAVSTSVNGGVNGVVSTGSTKAPSCVGQANSATAGAAGIAKTGYTAPLSSGNVCVILSSSLLKDFNGVLTDRDALLTWTLYAGNQVADLSSFTLERSVDQVHFTALTTLAASPDSFHYQYSDPSSFTGTVFYRLYWTNQQGLRSYSSIIALTRAGDPFVFVRLHPNPVRDQLTVELFAMSHATGTIRVFNAQGQQLRTEPLDLHIGTTSLTLPVADLAAGAYFLVAEAGDRRQVSPFIKKD